ncbi:MAG: type I methionyl aminopeptidase [Endomicrobia bacterium]|nr:type I methionyl aminopeptidase [Endomicrobiia bacterium]
MVIIETKSEQEIETIKKAASIVSKIIDIAKQNVRVGISTLDLEKIICETIKKFGCEPAFKGYREYPACSCISLDSELVHGVPDKRKIIKNGQLVSIDVGILYNGFYADAATTFFIDGDKEKKKRAQRLLDVTYNSIFKVLDKIKDNIRIKDIGSEIQRYVESHGFNVIREYVGHAIGRNLHEKPEIPNFEVNTDDRLLNGMIICVEPMVSMGRWETSILEDGWTVVMKDGSLCAHFEHMILVKKNRAEILTDTKIISPSIIKG